jgi:hypothetical protein
MCGIFGLYSFGFGVEYDEEDIEELTKEMDENGEFNIHEDIQGEKTSDGLTCYQ